ncbi:MAG: YitT family protein [Oscillospiraceae bacterium]|nr:YitT family protein [Oscillospiraceae bacterium]
MKKLIKKYFYLVHILLGAFILAFGMYNIHSRTIITEGGIWGIELLLDHWFGLSPAVTAPFLDGTCYLLGVVFLGKEFILKSLVGTLSYSAFYAVLEQFPPLLPDLNSVPLAAAVIGAIFVGIGAGIVVRQGGACAGDDALALAISKKLKCKISTAYLSTDMTVLLLSLTYIPFRQIAYSLITVLLSGWIIEKVQNFRKKDSVGAVLSQDM